MTTVSPISHPLSSPPTADLMADVDKTARGRRYLALRLPHLPLERLTPQRATSSSRSDTPDSRPPKGGNKKKAPPATPHATFETTGNAIRLAAVDRTAAEAGLSPGLTLSDARARRPDLEIHPADPPADDRTLSALADWASRYTPLVAIDRSAHATAGAAPGLVLDITGCAHLFGGEAGLLADLCGRLGRRGLSTAAAIADTPAAARATLLSGHITDSPPVVPPGGNEKAVRRLPVQALEADPVTSALLDRLGLKRIGQLTDLPRETLAARFGTDLLTRLDRTLGRAEEPLSPFNPPPVFTVDRLFAEPIRLTRDIERTIDHLTGSLAEPLIRHGQGARHLALTLFRLDNTALRIATGLSRASRDPDLMAALLRERLTTFQDGFDSGEGIEQVRLAAEAVDPLGPEQMTGEPATDLSLALGLAPDPGARDGVALARLADRLTARLGRDRVVRILRRDSHIPERAMATAPAVEDRCDPDRPETTARFRPHPGRAPERPLRLLQTPEPIEAIAEVPDGPPVRFRWRRVQRRIVRLEGPERIAPEWWRVKGLEDGGDALTRDYFRVEDEAGRRYWVYRAGLYGRETAAPRWYLHGLFG